MVKQAVIFHPVERMEAVVDMALLRSEQPELPDHGDDGHLPPSAVRADRGRRLPTWEAESC